MVDQIKVQTAPELKISELKCEDLLKETTSSQTQQGSIWSRLQNQFNRFNLSLLASRYWTGQGRNKDCPFGASLRMGLPALNFNPVSEKIPYVVCLVRIQE